MSKIVKLRQPPTEEERWRAIIKEAADLLQQARKHLNANKKSTGYSLSNAAKVVREALAELLQVSKSEPKKRPPPITLEERLRRGEVYGVNFYADIIRDVEHGRISEATFERLVLLGKDGNVHRPGFLWPAQIPLLADAVQRGLISAATYERILAAHEGNFVGKVADPPPRQRPN